MTPSPPPGTWERIAAASLFTPSTRSAQPNEQRPERFRAVLSTLCLFSGLTAIGGGAELVFRPDGSGIQAPISALRYSPFHDFLVPGLLLAGVVGATNTLAGVLALRRRAAANPAAIVSGAILATWIVVESILLRGVHWLHVVYLLLGLAIQAIAALRERRKGSLETTIRSLARLSLHGLVGWALCAATMATLLATTTSQTAIFVHALATPLIFWGVSAFYFRDPRASAPAATAIAFATLAALLDLVIVASFIDHSLDMFRSLAGTWLPFLLILIATWTQGVRISMSRAQEPATQRKVV